MGREIFIATLISILFVSILNIGFLYQYQFIIDALASQNLEGFIHHLQLMMLTVFVMLVFEYGRQVFNEGYLNALGYELQGTLLGKIFQKSYRDYQKRDPGYYTSQITQDIEDLKENYYDAFFTIFQSICSLIFASLALFELDILTACLILITSLLPVLIPYAFRARRRKVQNDLSQKRKVYHGKLLDHFLAFLEIKNIKPVSELIKPLNQSYLGIVGTANHLAKWTALMNVLVGLSFYLTIGLILLVGGYQVLRGSLTLGGLTVMLTISEQLVDPINSIASGLLERHAVTDLHEDLTKEEGTESMLSPSKLSQDDFRCLSLFQLSYSLEDKVLFKNLSVDFESGKHYLIRGQSGKGKSTLALLLTKNLPLQNGEISINTIPFQDLTYDEVQTYISYLPQQSHLFQETVFYNLTLGNEVPESKVLDLLEIFGLSGRFPNRSSLDELLTDRTGLSGGQKQGLVLIRSLLQERSVLLIDEGLSALDWESFDRVEAYLTSQKDKTVIHISHRVSEDSLKRYDHIFDLDNY